MTEIVKTIMEIGVTAASVAFLFYLMLIIVKKSLPNQEEYIKRLENLSNSTNKAIDEISSSTQNQSHTLEILNTTMQGQIKLMEVMMTDSKETQNKLYEHDTRAEKIFTMVHEIWENRHEDKK